jgi:tetratricopeptide (TPR) repeat protein
LICALLLGLTAAAFYPVLYNGLINLDDPSYVALNRNVQQGLTWNSVKWAFTTVDAANWHPVTWLSHMLDYQLYGEKVWGHHLSSLVLHCLNTLMLFLVLLRMTRTWLPSFLVAALFGVHPLHVESVAWVAERKDVLSAFFFILTLRAYAKYVHWRRATPSKESGREPLHRAKRAWVWYLLTLVLFILGLLSKPMLVTLPVVLLLLDFWPLHRLELKTLPSEFRLLFPVLVEKIPFFLLATASCIVTLFAQRAGGIVVSTGGAALTGRAGNALVSYVRYLGKLFWPVKLAIFYPLPDHWPVGTVVAAALVLLAISALALWLLRRAPYFAVGWCWFIATLLPVIGLVQVGHQAIADRYTYIPSIGVFLVVAWATCAIAGRWFPASEEPARAERSPIAAGPTLFAAAGGALLLGCVLLTRQQLGYWKDSESLLRHSLSVTENNAFTRETLGLALRIQGRLDESTAEMREAIRLSPNYAEAYRDLGYNLTLTTSLAEGIRCLRTALRLAPYLSRTHKQLGLALQREGRRDEALVQFQQELEINPKDAEAHNGLGASLLGFGRLDEAISEFSAALQLDPAYAEAHSNLGIALCRKGNWAGGIAQFESALHWTPDYAEAHNNLAVALVRTGRRVEAIHHFEQALKIRPNYPGAEQQLQALTNAPILDH